MNIKMMRIFCYYFYQILEYINNKLVYEFIFMMYMYSVLIIYRQVCYVFMKWDINIICIGILVKERVNYKIIIK